MKKKLIRHGLIASGLINIGAVLILSRGFTNTAINQADPIVMSNFGLLMIMVWGLAFLGASTIPSGIKWLAGAFAVEKLVYTIVWIRWILENSLTQLYATDIFAGIFYSTYGLNDFLFMCFFFWIFYSYHSKKIYNL